MNKTQEMIKIINFIKECSDLITCFPIDSDDEEQKVNAFKINDDFSLDVGNEQIVVEFYVPDEIKEIPVKINMVNGNFSPGEYTCSFKNFPKEVTREMYLYWNPNLNPMIGFPSKIGRLNIDYRFLSSKNPYARQNKKIIEASCGNNIDESYLFHRDKDYHVKILTIDKGELKVLPGLYHFSEPVPDSNDPELSEGLKWMEKSSD